MKTKSKRILSPLLHDLKSYKLKDLFKDANVGLSVAVLLIPQGLAYALLAGLPAIYGLYSAIIPVIIYAFFGTSRYLAVGPVAISSILVFQGVSMIAEPFSAEYLQLVITCGFYVGVLQLLLGVLKFGSLVNFIADPVIKGFIAAASLIIVVSQLKSAFGLSQDRGPSIIHNLTAVIKNIGQTNLAALGMFIVSVTSLYLLKRINKKIPSAFITVILAILATKFLHLDTYGVKILGSVGEGVPSLSLPTLNVSTFQALLPTILTLTIVNLVECISIGKALEDKTHIIKPNQEFIALGLSKIGGALTSAFPTSGSFSRSALSKDVMSSSQLSGVISAILVLLTLLVLTPLIYYLPTPTLAAIIIVSVLKLFDIKSFRHLYETHRRDFVVMVFTFIASLLLSIELGILIGVILSLVLVLQQSSKPQISILGKVPGTTNYRNVSVLKDLEEVDGTLIVRLENQLYFGNNEYFDEQIRSLVENNNIQINVIFLDAKSIFQIDSSGIDTLYDIIEYLNDKGIELHICSGMARFRHQLSKSGFTKALGPDRIHLSVHKAITQYQSKKNV